MIRSPLIRTFVNEIDSRLNGCGGKNAINWRLCVALQWSLTIADGGLCDVGMKREVKEFPVWGGEHWSFMKDWVESEFFNLIWRKFKKCLTKLSKNLKSYQVIETSKLSTKKLSSFSRYFPRLQSVACADKLTCSLPILIWMKICANKICCQYKTVGDWRKTCLTDCRVRNSKNKLR